jgi:ssDNA thymidine ADP-ribosyltransferase, DarT
MTLSLDQSVLAALRRLGVARLTHFTPARNLPHILHDRALRSVEEMAEDVRAAYVATDPDRYDGHSDKISCSLQYPNAYYFRKARERPVALNYPDWACLLLDPSLAARPGTQFCPRNASYGCGSLLAPGAEGLLACYAERVAGSGDVYYDRGPRHDPGSPTDVQAEVLVPAPIPLSHVQAVVLPSAQHVRQERARLRRLQLDPDAVTWVVSAGLFRVPSVVAAVRTGSAILETPWTDTLGTSP